MECWSIGALECWAEQHYSNAPILHHYVWDHADSTEMRNRRTESGVLRLGFDFRGFSLKMLQTRAIPDR